MYSGSIPQFRFYRLGGGEIDSEGAVSAWDAKPGTAFMEVAIIPTSTKEKRPYARMFLAVFHSEPQRWLAKHLDGMQKELPGDVQQLFTRWQAGVLGGASDSPSSSAGFATVDSTAGFATVDSTGEPTGRMAQKRLSSSLSCSATAACNDEAMQKLLKTTIDDVHSILQQASNRSMERDSPQGEVITPSPQPFHYTNNNNVRNALLSMKQLSNSSLASSSACLLSPLEKQSPFSFENEDRSGGTVRPSSLVTKTMQTLFRDSSSSLFSFSSSNSRLLDTDDDVDSGDAAHAVVVGRDAAKMSVTELFAAFKDPTKTELTKEELHQAMETLLRIPIRQDLVDDTFAACDANGNGRITLDEFVHFAETRERRLWDQFQALDADKSGFITFDELVTAKESLVLDAHKRDLAAVLAAVDFPDASDRKISWEEFRAMMILLPPATTIQTIVDLVKTSLHEHVLEQEASDSFSKISLRSASTVGVSGDFALPDILPLGEQPHVMATSEAHPHVRGTKVPPAHIDQLHSVGQNTIEFDWNLSDMQLLTTVVDESMILDLARALDSAE